jgi:hypothetical protein
MALLRETLNVILEGFTQLLSATLQIRGFACSLANEFTLSLRDPALGVSL